MQIEWLAQSVGTQSAWQGHADYLQAGHLAIVVFNKEDKELKKANERLAGRREAYRRGELEQDLSALSMLPKPFTWVRFFLEA